MHTFCKMHSILMRSLATVSMKICSIFAVIIAQTVLISMNSKKRLDLSKSKTICDLKYQNSSCRFMRLFTKSWWTFPVVDLILMHSPSKIYLKMFICMIFATWKWEKIRISFPVLLTKFFGFDMLFLLKRIRLLVWGTKDLNIGGSGLTNINFASLGSQVKFISTMKWHSWWRRKNVRRKTNAPVSKSTWLFLINLAAFGFRPKMESFRYYC